MGIRNRAFFLAIILTTAAPAFADSAASKALGAVMGSDRSLDSKQGLPSKNPLQNAWAFHNSGLDASAPRIDLGPAGSSRGFSDLSKGSGLGGSLNLGAVSNEHPVSVFDVDSHHGGTSGSNGDKDQGKNHPKNSHDGDGPLTLVAVLEPGSGILSLFGFAVLGMIAYRRKGPTNAI